MAGKRLIPRLWVFRDNPFERVIVRHIPCAVRAPTVDAPAVACVALRRCADALGRHNP